MAIYRITIEKRDPTADPATDMRSDWIRTVITCETDYRLGVDLVEWIRAEIDPLSEVSE